MALPDGTSQVSALNVTDLPPDNDRFDHDIGVMASPTQANRRTITSTMDREQATENAKRNLDTKDDGSVLDIMCIYTRQALCQEAVGVDFCNMTRFRHVMDDKCALAVAETVRIVVYIISIFITDTCPI